MKWSYHTFVHQMPRVLSVHPSAADLYPARGDQFILDRPNKTKDLNVKLHNMFIRRRGFLLHSQALSSI